MKLEDMTMCPATRTGKAEEGVSESQVITSPLLSPFAAAYSLVLPAAEVQILFLFFEGGGQIRKRTVCGRGGVAG